MDYINAFWGGRSDLRSRADSSGPNKTDAGKSHGAARMQRCSAWMPSDLRTISEVCGSRRECSAAWIWKCTLERSKRRSRQ